MASYKKNCKYIIGLLVLILIGVSIYMVVKGKNEGFTWANAVQELPGAYDNSYDLVENEMPGMSTFADIIPPHQLSSPGVVSPIKQSAPLPQPSLEHFDNRDLLPDVNTNVAMHDVDISDPEIFLWRPSARVQTKNRQQVAADPYRGDLPITKNGCHGNSGWFVSRYSESDAKLDGFFSEFQNAKFRSLTGQKSYPISISNEETIMDY
jgi:hypothetical protein